MQPRGDDPDVECSLSKNRFVWEQEDIRIDINGRYYRDNSNYWCIPHEADYLHDFAKRIEKTRSMVNDIILVRHEKRTNKNYVGSERRWGLEDVRREILRRQRGERGGKGDLTRVLDVMLRGWGVGMDFTKWW